MPGGVDGPVAGGRAGVKGKVEAHDDLPLPSARRCVSMRIGTR